MTAISKPDISFKPSEKKGEKIDFSDLDRAIEAMIRLFRQR